MIINIHVLIINTRKKFRSTIRYVVMAQCFSKKTALPYQNSFRRLLPVIFGTAKYAGSLFRLRHCKGLTCNNGNNNQSRHTTHKTGFSGMGWVGVIKLTLNRKLRGNCNFQTNTFHVRLSFTICLYQLGSLHSNNKRQRIASTITYP